MTFEDPVGSNKNELAFFFDLSLDMLAIADLNGYFKRVNAAFSKTLGYSETELLTKPYIELVHPDDRSKTLAEMQKLEAGTPTLYFENRYRAKDGSYRWLSWTSSPQIEQGVIYGVARDVTQQKQAEAALQQINQELEQRITKRTAQLERVNAALRESEERNELAMEVARMFTFKWEATTDAVKRSIQCGVILGLESELAEQDTGTNYFQRIHPEDRDRFIAIIKALTPENRTYRTIYRLVRPDHQIVILEESGRALFDQQGQLTQLIGMTADITERQQMEAELQENRATLQRQLTEIETIYQSAPIGLNFLDTDLRFVRINQRLAEINGFSEEEHIGRTIRELLPQLADTAENLLLPILETGEPLLNVEIRGETPAQPGVQRVWLENFLPLKDGDRIIGINTVCQEITERKKTEETLRQFKLLIELSHEPLFVWSVDSGIINWNQGCEQLYGYTRAEAMGQKSHTLLQTVHPLPLDEFMAILESDRIWMGELKQITRSGKQVIVESRQQLIETNGQKLILETNHDITDRKRTEEELRRSEERYRTLFETMEDGFCVIEMLFDENNRPIDYRFLEVNPAFERQTGLQQPLGKTARQLQPNLEEFWFETYGRVALTGEPIRFENGSEVMNRWFDVYAFPIGKAEEIGRGKLKTLSLPKLSPTQNSLDSGFTPFKVAILFKEISERKQAEAALRENEDRLQMAIASAQLGTWDWNLVTGELKWDTACKAMFGLSPEAESNMEVFFTGLHPDDRARLDRIVQTVIDPASGGFYDTEYRTIGIHDRVERWVKAKGQAYYDSNGKPLRFIGTVLNITEQKQTEAQREQLLRQEQAAREAAEHANQIKDEFLAVLSHELRTPLNPILGWAKLLQSPRISSQRLEQGLSTIERNAKQQAQLIDDLLDISRIIRGKLTLNFSVIRLSEPILAALETVRLAAEAKSIQLEVFLDSSLGQVRGDAGRLQQVIWNLLSNAIKFTPAGGRVEVRLEQENSPSSQSPKLAQITVSDTGKGIKPEFLPFVFELFRQQDSSTTRSFGGLGLGLAIAYQVVEAHGGTITVTSAGEGQGATFTVQLPLISALSPNLADSLNDQTLDLKNLRVLVVDDDADARELVKLLLEQEGAIVQAVSLASEALQILTQTQFDLIISDIGMPEMNGYVFIRQVRNLPSQSNPGIPAIALTAYAGENNQHRALTSGFQLHLAKPIAPQQLLNAIVKLVKGELEVKNQVLEKIELNPNSQLPII